MAGKPQEEVLHIACKTLGPAKLWDTQSDCSLRSAGVQHDNLIRDCTASLNSQRMVVVCVHLSRAQPWVQTALPQEGCPHTQNCLSQSCASSLNDAEEC